MLKTIKELCKEGSKRYFQTIKNNQKIIFSIYDFNEENPKSIEQVEKSFKSAKLPSYIIEKYTIQQIFNKPLAIFQLDIYKWGNELRPMNMSLWEYRSFIKEDKRVSKALKMASISQSCIDDDSFYIACENCDSDSMVNDKNMSIVNRCVNSLSKELEKILGKSFSHVESY